MSRQDGFTLIELMVVVLIVAILIAIAVPTFVGQRVAAQDRAAQSAARTAFVTEKTAFAAAGEYTASVVDLNGIEPSLVFQNTLTPTLGSVGVAVSPTGQSVCMIVLSDSGSWFGIWDSASEATLLGKGAAATDLFASCSDAVPAGGAWASGAW